MGAEKSTKFVAYLGHPHPLLIPSVLQEVLMYLPCDSLKIFRFVCQVWNQEGLKMIPEITKVCFRNWKQVAQFVFDFEEVDIVPFKHFQFGQNNLDINDNVELVGNELKIRRPKIELEGRSARQFFIKFGHQIKHLELHGCLNSGNELGTILFEKVPNLVTLTLGDWDPGSETLIPISLRGDETSERTLPIPRLNNLQTVHLNMKMFREWKWRSRRDLSPVFKYSFPVLSDLISLTPNLHTITAPGWTTFVTDEEISVSDDPDGEFIDIPAGTVFFLNPINPLKNLSEVDFNVALNNETLQLFASQKLRLSILKLTLESDSCTGLVDSLFNNLNTLTKLTLRSHFIPDFTPLTELKCLKLFSTRSKLFYESVSQLLRQTPQVESLKFNRISLNKVMSTKPRPLVTNKRVAPLLKLRTIEISEMANFGKYSCCAKSISKLSSVLNTKVLKKLKIDGLTDDALRAVFTSFRMLEEFASFHGHFTDSGVTGQIVETSAPLNKVKESKRSSCKRKIKVWPRLRDMAKLRKLEFESPNLNDHSVLMEAVHCKNLKEIHLSS